tara:strand:- start:16875 stop:17912 length:1038 start_codon:yes stop_codon:yes gene_type:complete
MYIIKYFLNVFILIPILGISQDLPNIYTNGGNKIHDWKKIIDQDMQEYGESFVFTCFMVPEKSSASSFLRSQGSNSYPPTNLTDFNPLTAWVEGRSGDGIGEIITFEGIIPNMILNGYQKSVKTYYNNSRVKTFKVYFNGKELCYLHLDDVMGKQRFELPVNSYEGYLEFEIIKVYEGEKWNDTAISQIGREGCCFSTETAVSLDMKKTPKNLKKFDLIDVIDENFSEIKKASIVNQIIINHSKLIELETDNYKLKVTPDHPLYFEDYGFTSLIKILSIKKLTDYNDLIGELKVMVWSKKDNRLIYTKVKSLTLIEGDFETYTITKLSDGENYFANGFLQKTYSN